MGLRLNGGKAQGENGLQGVAGRDREQRAAEGLCGGAVLRLAQAALNPAAAQPQVVGHQVHIAHGNGTVLGPDVGFFRIGKDQNGGLCPGQHGCGTLAAMRQGFQRFGILNHNKLPGPAAPAGGGEEPCGQNGLQSPLRNGGFGVPPDAPAGEKQIE